jgi:hypothetical protein
MALSKQLQRIHEAIMTIKQYGGVFGRNPTFNNVTIEGTLTFDGDIDINSDLTISGNLYLPDNSKAIFGNNDDLQIYHDGSHSYIKDTATGNLRIDGTDIQIRSATGANMAAFVSGAEVQLYHNNQKKLDTTTTGIDVTGSVTADGLTVDGNARIEEIGAIAKLTLERGGSANAADSAAVDLLETNAGSEGANFGDPATNGFRLKLDGSANDFLIQSGASGTVNTRFGIDRDSGDISFYDDAAAQGLFWDSSASRLGLGTTTPSAKLSIYDASSADSTGLVISNGYTTDAAGDTTEIMFQHYRSYSPSVTDSAFIKATKTQAWDATGYRTSKLEFGTRNGATEPETRMTIMPDGSVGIGEDNPSGLLHLTGDTNSNGAELFLQVNNNNTTDNLGAIHFGNNIDATLNTILGGTSGANNSSYLTFSTSNAGTLSEAMRIDASGNLLVGMTSGTSSDRVQVSVTDGVINGVGCYATTTAGGSSLVNRNSADTYVGGVSFTNTATSFPTSSDQRLKENIADADDAGSKIDSIQVRKFDWKADGSHQDYGMVAQELQTVAPEAVSAPEDPEEMMGVDYSKLVPMMLKEIQSLRARIAALEP